MNLQLKKIVEIVALATFLFCSFTVAMDSSEAYLDSTSIPEPLDDAYYPCYIGETGYVSLQEAIGDAKNGDTISLNGHITTSSTILIDKSITLDLYGFDLSRYYGDGPVLEFTNGDSKIENGRIYDFISLNSAKSDITSIIVKGSSTSLTMTDCSLYAYAPLAVGKSNIAVEVSEGANLTLYDSRVAMSVDTYNPANGILYGIGVFGTGDKTVEPTSLTINGDSTINVNSFGIFGNGSISNPDYRGTKITINGGTINAGNSTGIYHPQAGTLTITGGSITAATGIEIRSGSLIISGNPEITSTDTSLSIDTDPSDGNSIGGAAIAVSQHSTKLDIEVNISGGTFSGPYGIYECFLFDEPVGNIIMNISGGDFTETTEAAFESENCTDFLSGGTYNTDVSDSCASGYAAINNGDGTFTVDAVSDYNVTLSTGNTSVNIGDAVIIAATGFPNFTNMDLAYTWSEDGTVISDATESSLTVYPEANTVYSVTVYGTINGTSVSDTASIDISISTHTVTFTYGEQTVTQDVTGGTPVSEPTEIVAPEGFYLVWNTDSGVWDFDDPVTGNLSLTGSLEIIDFDVTINKTGSTVEGLTVTLEASFDRYDGITYVYAWSDGSAGDSITVNSTGTYTVTVTASYKEAANVSSEAEIDITFAPYGYYDEGIEVYAGFGDFRPGFNGIADGTTTYSSSNPSLVTVDNTGLITYVSSNASVSEITITATTEYDGQTYSDAYSVTLRSETVYITTDTGIPDPVVTVPTEEQKDEIVAGINGTTGFEDVTENDLNIYDVTVPTDEGDLAGDSDRSVTITVAYSMFGVSGPDGYVFHIFHLSSNGLEVIDGWATSSGVQFTVDRFSPFAFYAEEVTEPTPSVSVSTDNSMPITGETVTITANVSNATGTITYQWFKDGQAMTGETESYIEVTEGGTYTVQVTVGDYRYETGVTVGFTSILSVTFTYGGETKGFGVYYNGTVNDPGFAVADGFAIRWTTSDGKVWAPGTPVRSSLSLTGTLVIAEPDVTITSEGDAIEGQTVTLTADVAVVDGITYSYLWSTGETTRSIQVTGDGTYSVVVTASCEGLESVTSDAKTAVDFRGVIVEFVADGRVTSVEVTPGQTVTAPAVQSVAGFDVVWKTADGQVWDLSAPVTEGMTLTAERVLQSPVVTISDEGTTETGDTVLSANVSNRNPSITYTYTWSDGSAAQTTTVSESGTYTVTVTASYEGAVSATGTAQAEVTVSGTGSGSGSGTSEVVISDGGSDTTGILAVAAGVCAAALIALVIAAECRKR